MFFFWKKLGFLWLLRSVCDISSLWPRSVDAWSLLVGGVWVDGYCPGRSHNCSLLGTTWPPHINISKTYLRRITKSRWHHHLLINISIYLWITSPTLQCYPESIYMHINISPKFHDWSVARNDGKPPELIAGNFSFLWNQFLSTGPTVQTHPTFLNNFLFSFYRAPTNKNNNFSRRPLSNSKPISELNKKIYIFCCRQHFLFYSPSSNIFCPKFACLAFGWQRASKQAFRSFFLQNLF